MGRERSNLGRAHEAAAQAERDLEDAKMVKAQCRLAVTRGKAEGVGDGEMRGLRLELRDASARVEEIQRDLAAARKAELDGRAPAIGRAARVPRANLKRAAEAVRDARDFAMTGAAPQLLTVAQTGAAKVTITVRTFDEEGTVHEDDVHLLRTPQTGPLDELLARGELGSEHIDAADAFRALGDRAFADIGHRKMRFGEGGGEPLSNEEKIARREEARRIFVKLDGDPLLRFEFKVIDAVVRHGDGLAAAGRAVSIGTDRHRHAERAVSYLVSGLERLVLHWRMRPGVSGKQGG